MATLLVLLRCVVPDCSSDLGKVAPEFTPAPAEFQVTQVAAQLCQVTHAGYVTQACLPATQKSAEGDLEVLSHLHGDVGRIEMEEQVLREQQQEAQTCTLGDAQLYHAPDIKSVDEAADWTGLVCTVSGGVVHWSPFLVQL